MRRRACEFGLALGRLREHELLDLGDADGAWSPTTTTHSVSICNFLLCNSWERFQSPIWTPGKEFNRLEHRSTYATSQNTQRGAEFCPQSIGNCLVGRLCAEPEQSASTARQSTARRDSDMERAVRRRTASETTAARASAESARSLCLEG